MSPFSCPFCDYAGPNPVLNEWDIEGERFFLIEPLNPVTEGHLLVIPRRHVSSATVSPNLAGTAFAVAAGYVPDEQPCNFITSCGVEATQTIRHLHIHIVPRRQGDGLKLPWSAA